MVPGLRLEDDVEVPTSAPPPATDVGSHQCYLRFLEGKIKELESSRDKLMWENGHLGPKHQMLVDQLSLMDDKQS